ncbi:MAG: PilZ domain-containing protein [Desulfobacterales bacterium]|nr:PilZ domain-containing protein [Desulfobacterales bacterium]
MLEQENRIYPRGELTWPISAQAGGSVIEGVTKNIGVSGAYVCCARPLRLNEVFDMVINTPDKPLNIKAEVVWSNIYGPDDKINPRGMGVRFIEISDEDRRLITHEVTDNNLVQEASEYLNTLELETIADLNNE